MDTKIPLLIFFICLAAASNPIEAAPPMESRVSMEGIFISEDGKPILFYQKTPKARDGNYKRSNYIHPLYNLKGQIITEDFPADHLHQRGVFWTWHQILVGERRLGDGWECRDIQWDVLAVETSTSAAGAIVLKSKAHWKSPNLTSENGEMVPFVEEKTTITIYPAKPGNRDIDFEIRLKGLVNDVRLGGSEDAKGYGGFSPRLVLPEDVVFRGIDDLVTPETTAIQAGPVIDISGRYEDSGSSGVTVIQHPDNPGFPQGWILRSRASMQNAVWPGRNTIGLSTSLPVVLKYRLVLHDSQEQDLRTLYNRYSGKN